jgi:DNA-binding NarL/FixJ family response regulator
MKNTPKVDACGDLTPRELRVTALVAMGHRDGEIAYTLGLSKASVTSSLHRARTKLNVSSRTELAAVWRKGRQG